MTDQPHPTGAARGQLLHICSVAEWEEAQRIGHIDNPSLHSEGFIHCSYAYQVLIPANDRFRHRQDLLLLTLDVDKIDVELVVEDSYNSGMEFPHFYDLIPAHGITEITEFPSNSNGHFDLPANLTPLT